MADKNTEQTAAEDAKRPVDVLVMPFRLMVSHNCGISYCCEKESNNAEDFLSRIKECERDWLRWCIEDSTGKMTHLSSIHLRTIAVIAAA